MEAPPIRIDNHTSSNSVVVADEEIYQAVTMMAVVIIIGTIGNTLVISVLCIKNSSANSRWNRYRRQQRSGETNNAGTGAFDRDKTLDFFVLVLAISDLFVCVVIIPSTITIEIFKYRISIDFLCKMFYVFLVANTTFSSLLISTVALDRYLFICQSLKRIITLIRAKVLVTTLALFSLGVGIAAGCAVGIKMEDDGKGIQHICDEIEYIDGISYLRKKLSQVIKYFNHACFLACILIVIVLYSCVFWAIVSTRSRGHKLTVPVSIHGPNEKKSTYDSKSSGNIKDSRRRRSSVPSKFRQKAQFTLQNLRSVLMLFIIAIVYILTFVTSLIIANAWTKMNLVLFYLYYINSAANPCIYAIFTPSFRQTVVVLIRSCCCLKDHITHPPIVGRDSKHSDIGSSIMHKNSRDWSHLRSKKHIREDAFPFITREQRRAAAAMRGGANSAITTSPPMVSKLDASNLQLPG
ncbi:unnamed protein product [Hymenolepis diminuta]|uniref:G_PROTEIN_RECEP_F1_2 domain-containing protein n=1 Tax=Hymenolepis diminuta TaxID=6216 RepID=A0A0R3SAW3_HYMDI|nr:unnamed protein product [Hymenolepis diminuta]VUZ41878.1 unnamed protein product [Hymenolepis diminuta]